MFKRPEPSFREFIMVKKSSGLGGSHKNEMLADLKQGVFDTVNPFIKASSETEARFNPEHTRYRAHLEKYDKISQAREKMYQDAILKDYTSEKIHSDSFFAIPFLNIPLPHASKGQFLGYWTAFSIFSYAKIFGNLDEWKARDKTENPGVKNMSESLKNLYTNYEKMNIFRFSSERMDKSTLFKNKDGGKTVELIKNQIDPHLKTSNVKNQQGTGVNQYLSEQEMSGQKTSTSSKLQNQNPEIITREAKMEFRKEMLSSPKDFTTAKNQLFHHWDLKNSFAKAGHSAIIGFILTTGFTITGAILSKIFREFFHEAGEIINYSEHNAKVRELYGQDIVKNQKKQQNMEDLNFANRFNSYRLGLSNEESKSNSSGYEIVLPPEKQGGMKQQDVDYLMWKMSTGQVQVGKALKEQYEQRANRELQNMENAEKIENSSKSND